MTRNGADPEELPEAAPPCPQPSPYLVFTSRGLPKAQQAEAWRAGNAPSLDLVFDATRSAEAGFYAEREVIPFGPFRMTRVTAERLTAIRTVNHIRRDGLDHWSINVATRGDRRFRWTRGDRCLTVPAGQLHVQALDETYQGFAEDLDWIGIFFSRESLPTLSALLDASRDQPRTDALSRLLADYLVRLWPILPAMTQDELTRTAEATTAMIRACLTRDVDATVAAGPHLRMLVHARAVSVIRRNLGSSRLTPQSVARMLGISRSQLYRAFEEAGGIAHVIRDERLTAAQRLLAKQTDIRSAREIADTVGIFDQSSFTRMFQRSFGMTPGEWRKAARAADAARAEQALPRFSLADFLA